MVDPVFCVLPELSLDDLSDGMVRHMTERDLTIILYRREGDLDAKAVMDELRLQQRWDRLHPGGQSGV